MSFAHFDAGGISLLEEPAREDCFTVVRRDADMHEFDDTGINARKESLHRHMANEITSIDIAAQMLVDFPDAPWELRMELARQCWDETRHVAILYRRLRELGGEKGEFPVTAFEWCITSAIDNIAGRLATQNRTFEAGAMDVVGGLIETVRKLGDDVTAEILDGILADEIQHVRFANHWIKDLVKRDRRNLLRVAHAVRFLEQANAFFQTGEGEVNPVGMKFGSMSDRTPSVNIEDRKLADFDEDEIRVILEQAGFKTLATEAEAE